MAKSSRKWPSEVITQFLEAYEQYPCLWNHKSSIYKDRNKRDEALRKIVEVMSDSVKDFDVNSAKANIRSIRNAYTLEHHKVVKSYKSGTSTDTIYKPTVSWFSVADRFLKHIVETRDTKNTLESQQSQNADESQEIEGNETSFHGDYAEETTVDCRSNQSPAPSASKQAIEAPQNMAAKKTGLSKNGEPACKKTKFSKIDVVTKAVNTLKEIVNTSGSPQTTTDEYEAFGKTVAAHLKQLPMDTALESQSDILYYLVQKRLGRRGSLSTIMSPTNYTQYISTPYQSPSSCPSNSSLAEEVCNDLHSATQEQQATTSNYETTDILRQAWNHMN